MSTASDHCYTRKVPTNKILTFDGGGIYGLSTSIILRKLCEENKTFLDGKDVELFAGTSAGALIALLLAKEECPREAVLNGTLENFFKEPGLFTNNVNPVAGVLSLFMIGAWSGQADFMEVLDKYFGNITLGEMPQRVLTTSFDYSGKHNTYEQSKEMRGFGNYEKPWGPKIFTNYPDAGSDLDKKASFVGYGCSTVATSRRIVDGISDGGIYADNPVMNSIAKLVAEKRSQLECVTGTEDSSETPFLDMVQHLITIVENLRESDKHGKGSCLPKFYNSNISKAFESVISCYNKLAKKREIETFHPFIPLLQETNGRKEDTKQLYVEVNSFIQHVVQTFSDNDTNEEILKRVAELQEDCEVLWKLNESLGESQKDNRDHFKRMGRMYIDSMHHLLIRIQDMIRGALIDERATSRIDKINVLSLGVCVRTPHYYTPTFSESVLSYNLISTNIAKQFFFPPEWFIGLDGPGEDSLLEAMQLLPEGNLFRFNPPVIGFPLPAILPSVYSARWAPIRNFIIDNVYRLMDQSPAISEGIDLISQWLDVKDWTDEPQG